ncbi:Reverse transcriptase (RNA-dependent DNA polymerase) [Fragilaria crotonensis]|nr:Reverse transcriptase (RNA-dependent DNA polymerase) [Fragilaria crotonensis]
MRLFFALCAHEGYVSLKVDATNAYANSPPPNQPTFVVIDDQYADWYLARHGTVVSREMVLPVQHALQGHPESGALWEKFVNSVIARHGFTSTTHERSLYQGTYKGHRMLICRQVDDMAIGCVNVDAIKDLVRVICAEDGIDLRDEGILNSFNGVDVDQRDRYIKITCETYIDKLLAHYGWSSSGSRETDEKPIEPLAASTTQQMFDDYANAPRDGTAEYYDLETAAGFSYRSVLGALIYAYVVARPDIGYAVTTLARFSDHPAKVHYDALRRVARFSFRTRPPDFPQVQSSTELAGYVDAAHATDLVTRRSITGLVFMFCGGPLAYKSKIQSTVSTSSTEAEFLAAVHAAKIAKYLRSILSELGYAQLGPTTLFEDNAAAILMVNASRPTPRARHIDIQHFALQEWKAANEIVLSHIPGVVNSADSLTKSLGPTLHHRHRANVCEAAVLERVSHDVFEDDEDDVQSGTGDLDGTAKDVEDHTPESYDEYLTAQVLLPQGGEAKKATVIGRKRDHDGRPIGQRHANPLLDSRLYEVEFPDGSTEAITANLIAENILSQVDDEGRSYAVMSEIVDHRTNGHALSKDEWFVEDKRGRRHPRITTRGWELQVEWRDGSTTWVPLSELKESNPVQVAEYAVANKIAEEPAFAWWVRNVLRKRDRIIKKVKARYWAKTHKFGIELPKTVAEALKIDERTGTDFWRKAIELEMKNVMPAFEFIDDDAVPKFYKKIDCHMIFDVKMDLTRKARLVAGGHQTDPPKESTYSSVVSRDSIRIAFTLAALNDLNVLSADVQGAYLNAPTKEKVYTTAGLEFGADKVGRPVLIVRASMG